MIQGMSIFGLYKLILWTYTIKKPIPNNKLLGQVEYKNTCGATRLDMLCIPTQRILTYAEL
jgi:hypothetical protein